MSKSGSWVAGERNPLSGSGRGVRELRRLLVEPLRGDIGFVYFPSELVWMRGCVWQQVFVRCVVLWRLAVTGRSRIW
jgi:hypothetical protein